LRGLFDKLARGLGVAGRGDAVGGAIDDPEGRALVERWRRGDAQAFNDLFRAHRRLVHGLLHDLVPNEDVEDLVQVAFVEVFRSLDRFEGRSRLSSWIARVTLHVGYHHLRTKRRRPVLVKGLPELPDVVDEGRSGDVEGEVERRCLRARVQAIVAGLAEKKRTVLVLNDFQGIAQEQIAEILGVPVATVRTRLFHARRELWREIERDEALRGALGAQGARSGEGGAVVHLLPVGGPARAAAGDAATEDDEDQD
jgi:RNA polymerase sigma-70 factor (ECF subfamily)